MRIGFIGAGRMGAPMAGHLLAAGHALAVCDVRAEAVAQLAERGARAARSPADAMRDAELVVLSLPGPEEVDQVAAGPDGLLAAVRPGQIIADTSTIGATQSRRLAEAFAAKGASYLDWPITGGQEGAVKATLSMMVGGDRGAYERALPAMRCLGPQIHYMGPSGAGSGMKLIIQHIYLSQLVTFFEGVALGDRLGIDLDAMLEIIKGSSARHPTIEKRYDKIKAGDLSPRFEIRLAKKDLDLARGLMAELGGNAPMCSGAVATLAEAIAQGHGDHDAVALRDAHKRWSRG